MEEVGIIGIDLAKRSFQVHGARADGSVAHRGKLSRGRLLSFLASQPKCTVAMEACAGAHHWGREILPLGHEVRLVPPIHVKPFVKRHKNDAADAEAITEAAQRPTMHFVEVKTEAQQAQAMLFHTRDLLVRQRTQTINALRGHLAEHGVVAPQGRARIGQLAAALEDADRGLPGPWRSFATRSAAASSRIRGWPGCWRASRGGWSRWRSPTGRRGGSGRWPRERRTTGLPLPPERPTSAASRGRTYDSTRPDCPRLGSESALARLGASTYVIAGQLQRDGCQEV